VHVSKFEIMYVPFVQLKFSVYGHTQTDIHTYTRVLQCRHASVGLGQARPNYTSVATIVS